MKTNDAKVIGEYQSDCKTDKLFSVLNNWRELPKGCVPILPNFRQVYDRTLKDRSVTQLGIQTKLVNHTK